MKYTSEIVKLRENNFLNIVNTLSFNEFFFEQIIKILKPNDKILDIGTGNGYILSELQKRVLNIKLDFFGVDISKSMIEQARSLTSTILFKIASNYNLPFSNNYFDIITSKNVTNFDANELFRVLKNDGFVIFREYGEGKGLIEVSNLFSNRLINSRSIENYINEFKEAGFTLFFSQSFIIKRRFKTIDEIINTIKSFSYVKNFSDNDIDLIKQKLNNLEITSDPFLIILKKEKK